MTEMQSQELPLDGGTQVVERVIEKAPESESQRVERERDEIRDLQRKAFDKAQEAKDVADEAVKGKAKAEPKEPAKEPAKEAKADGPARDETGKFKAKDDTTKAKGAPKAEAKDAKAEPKAEAKDDTPAPKHSVKAPGHWPEALKEKFAGLDEDTAKLIAEAGTKDRQIITRLGEQAKGLEPILKTMNDAKSTFDRHNLSLDQGLRELVNASNALERDPAGTLRQLAQRYNVDLWELADGSQGQPQQTADPQLLSKIDQLERRLQGYEAREQETAQRAREQQSQSVQSIVEDFAKDKPDFDLLESYTAANINALREQHPTWTEKELLARAYEDARWSHPDTREKLMAERSAEAEKERAARQAQEAEAAKAAKAVNVTGAADTLPAEEDLRDVQRKAWDKLNAG